MVCFGKSFLKNEIFFAPKLHSLILFFVFLQSKRVVGQANMCILQKFELLPNHYLY